WGLDIIFSVARLENVQRAMIRLMYGTLLDKFPTVKILMPHLGAGFFGYLGRVSPSFSHYYKGDVDISKLSDIEKQKTKQTEKRLAQLYFESAPPHWRPVEFKCAFDTYGEDHITLGSDYPVGPDFLPQAVAIVKNANVPQTAKNKILGDNAVKLFRIKK
ncbi:MAG: amidohydrolase family protein, partial [Chloroflexi bacterium]|nr:amidohydrolase family protein [Chloroflexota bacterium]